MTDKLEDLLARHGRCGYQPALGAYECGIKVGRTDMPWADHYAAAVRVWLAALIDSPS